LFAICVKCGAPLKNTDKFCTVCGSAAPKFTEEEYTVSSKNLVNRVGELLHEGNVTRVIVKDEVGKTLLEILQPWVLLSCFGSVVGRFRCIAALVANCKIVVDRENKEVILVVLNKQQNNAHD